MIIESANYPFNDRAYIFTFEPPVELDRHPMPEGRHHDLPAVVAAYLMQGQGLAAVKSLAHTLYVRAEVAPNPQAYAEQLTDLTQGDLKVRVQ